MTLGVISGADDCQRAVLALKEKRPASYTPMLEFYGKLFSLQEAALLRVDVPAIDVEPALLAVKTRDHFPLISLADFHIDQKASRELFYSICRLSNSAEDGLQAAARQLKAAIDQNTWQLEDLFAGLLAEDSAIFKSAAEALQADMQSLVFICYHSIRPSIVQCASQLKKRLKLNAHWPEGYCPICGSPPGLSVLDDAGQRFMVCGFCWHQWPVMRGGCPFCKDQKRQLQRYFYSETEREYRVDTCDSCKTYLKTIDMRALDRPVYLPLEQVATLHLDIKAQDLGFKSHLQLEVGG
jgi:FdhE protein